MAEYKVVNATQLDNDLKGICDTIRNYPNSGYTGTEKFDFPNGIKTAITTGYQSAEAKGNDTLHSVLSRTGKELNCNASIFGNSACVGWAELEKARLPLAQSFASQSFRNCTGLKMLDVGDPTRTDIYVDSSSLYFTNGSFNGASALDVLVLRPKIVATIQSKSVFLNTPLVNGMGLILVPNNIVEEYRSATNWVAVGSEIRSIEMYTKDGTTTGELFEDAISAYLATLG